MKVKKPNATLYFIAYIIFYPLLKLFFRLKPERSGMENLSGAHIVIANHSTLIDFLLVMLAYYPKRLNAVTAQKFFLIKPLHKFLPMMGCISKNMFDPDVRSIVGIKTVLKRGDGIFLFPEGRCSIANAYSGINKSTGKLIKKLGVPVISCYIEGVYVCMPHWRKLFRRGKIRLTFKTLFTTDDIKKLSIDEINRAIDLRLSGAEGALPIKKPFRTAGKKRLAEGLHKILYWCPVCNCEYTTDSFGNEIRCKNCDSGATLDCYQNLTFHASSFNPVQNSASSSDFDASLSTRFSSDGLPSSIKSWFSLQVKHEMDALCEDMEPISEKVTVMMPSQNPNDGTVVCGSGVMKLDPTGWHYAGELYGEATNLHFPIETIPAISYESGMNFQIYFGGKYYIFLPEDRRKCLKYAILTECVHWKFSPRTQMTHGDVGFAEFAGREG